MAKTIGNNNTTKLEKYIFIIRKFVTQLSIILIRWKYETTLMLCGKIFDLRNNKKEQLSKTLIIVLFFCFTDLADTNYIEDFSEGLSLYEFK